MKCPFCFSSSTQVADTRFSVEDNIIRRRRRCNACERRFSTHESVIFRFPTIVKEGGQLEDYSRSKLYQSIAFSLKNCDVDADVPRQIVENIEAQLYMAGAPQIATQWLSERVLEALKPVNSVAYVRFASIHHAFQKTEDFKEILWQLDKQALLEVDEQ